MNHAKAFTIPSSGIPKPPARPCTTWQDPGGGRKSPPFACSRSWDPFVHFLISMPLKGKAHLYTNEVTTLHLNSTDTCDTTTVYDICCILIIAIEAWTTWQSLKHFFKWVPIIKFGNQWTTHFGLVKQWKYHSNRIHNADIYYCVENIRNNNSVIIAIQLTREAFGGRPCCLQLGLEQALSCEHSCSALK